MAVGSGIAKHIGAITGSAAIILKYGTSSTFTTTWSGQGAVLAQSGNTWTWSGSLTRNGSTLAALKGLRWTFGSDQVDFPFSVTTSDWIDNQTLNASITITLNG